MITNPNAPTAITPAILATMDAGLANLRTGCAALPTADAALLRRAAKMGLKSETFSREAIELAKQNTHLCPAGIDLEQAERTMAVRDALLSRYLQARQLAEALEVAMQVCGVDVFDTARTAYKSMKANCRDAALLELIDHLGRNFRSRRAEKAADADEESQSVPAVVAAHPKASDSAASGVGPENQTTPNGAARDLHTGADYRHVIRAISTRHPHGSQTLTRQPRCFDNPRRPGIYWIGSVPQNRAVECRPRNTNIGQLSGGSSLAS